MPSIYVKALVPLNPSPAERQRAIPARCPDNRFLFAYFDVGNTSIRQIAAARADQCLSRAVHDRPRLAFNHRSAADHFDSFRYLDGGGPVDSPGLSADYHWLCAELGSPGRHKGSQKNIWIRISATRAGLCVFGSKHRFMANNRIQGVGRDWRGYGLGQWQGHPIDCLCTTRERPSPGIRLDGLPLGLY